MDTAGDGSEGTRRRRRRRRNELAQTESSGPEAARLEEPGDDDGGDVQKKKHKKRKDRGTDANSSVVVDSCPGSQGASTKGTDRPKKKRKKHQLGTNVVGQDITGAGPGQESGGLRSSDGGDIPSTQVGDEKLDKRERKRVRSARNGDFCTVVCTCFLIFCAFCVDAFRGLTVEGF